MVTIVYKKFPVSPVEVDSGEDVGFANTVHLVVDAW